MSAKKKPDELLTTNQAAAYMSQTDEPLTLAGMRSLARFARIRGFELLAPQEQWPDLRTRMYSKNALEEYKKARATQNWKIPVEKQDVAWYKRKSETTDEAADEPAEKPAEKSAGKGRGKTTKSA